MIKKNLMQEDPEHEREEKKPVQDDLHYQQHQPGQQ
jgi:hypothetical protein